MEQKNKHLGIHIDPELHYKLKYLAAYEGRVPSTARSSTWPAARSKPSKKSTAKSSCQRPKKNKRK